MGDLGNLEDVAVVQRVDRIPELSVSIWHESVDRGQHFGFERRHEALQVVKSRMPARVSRLESDAVPREERLDLLK